MLTRVRQPDRPSGRGCGCRTQSLWFRLHTTTSPETRTHSSQKLFPTSIDLKLIQLKLITIKIKFFFFFFFNEISDGYDGYYLDVESVALSELFAVATVLEADASPAGSDHARIGAEQWRTLHAQIRMEVCKIRVNYHLNALVHRSSMSGSTPFH